MNKSNKFSPEVRERAMRMVQEHRADSGLPSPWAAIKSIAPKIGCVSHTLNEWVKKAQFDDSEQRAGTITSNAQRIKELFYGVKTIWSVNHVNYSGIFEQSSKVDGLFS